MRFAFFFKIQPSFDLLIVPLSSMGNSLMASKRSSFLSVASTAFRTVVGIEPKARFHSDINLPRASPSGTTASSFSLIDVKVGNRSQLANSTAVPAQTFTEVSVGVRLALDTATVAMDIALVVENITSDNQTFQAALIGTAAQ